MVKFLVKMFVFSVFPVLSLFAIIFFEDGKIDHFYGKVTTSKKRSMIFGISKSEQGIMPSVLNKKIKDADFYNFSFALSASPYGKAYYESIKKKIDYTKTDGLYILTIDPWSVISTKVDPENENLFEENTNFLGTIPTVSLNPNIFYLKDYFSRPLYETIYRYFVEGRFILHKDGWLEVNSTSSLAEKESKIRDRISQYKLRNEHYKISKKRFEYFERTIQKLSVHGKVYVVRLPVDAEILKLENFHNPEFDSCLNSILIRHELDYLDFTIDSVGWFYNDGIHLEKSSAKVISEQIADWILSLDD